MIYEILENEVNDFVQVLIDITGGGFSYRYEDGKLYVKNAPELVDWKNTPEYISLKRQQKLDAKYNKELKKFLWNEVKKNKDVDLDADDLLEIDKKLSEL